MFKYYIFASRGKYIKNISGSFLQTYKLLITSVQQILYIKATYILPSSLSHAVLRVLSSP